VSQTQNQGNTKTPKPSKTIRNVIITLVVIIVIPYVIYFGFCHGWWLRENLWANYWWYCNCGEEFERSLYPDNVEIVVPACRDPRSAVISSDGRYMVVKLGDWPGKTELVLLDLTTGEERNFSYPLRSGRPSNMGFWTDGLFLVEGPRNTFDLVDVAEDKVLNLDVSGVTSKDRYFHYEIQPVALQALQEANLVLMRPSKGAVLALAADPRDGMAKNYLLRYPEGRLSTEAIEKLFLENNIDYEISEPCWSSSPKRFCASHNGYLLATDSAIFTTDEQMITKLPNSHLSGGTGSIAKVGWSHNDDGIYIRLGKVSIIESGWLTPSYFPIPQPIVKLKVPEDYLQPTPSP
jgi:hypothetical protein